MQDDESRPVNDRMDDGALLRVIKTVIDVGAGQHDNRGDFLHPGALQPGPSPDPEHRWLIRLTWSDQTGSYQNDLRQAHATLGLGYGPPAAAPEKYGLGSKPLVSVGHLPDGYR